ncbi:MAG TPA: glycosyltransferase family 2 protein [Nitrososphaera sp.]|nr:glycosyltransferase family 2 protein [Nitrososphaera sp.]
MLPSRVAVILINHGHGNLAIRAVQSLYAIRDEASLKLVFIDNLKGDLVVPWLTLSGLDVTVIENERPHGFAHNVNEGLQHVGDTPYVMLMNPDIECIPGLLRELVDYMDTHEGVGATGPLLLNPDGTVQPSARAFSTLPALLIRGLHLDGLFKNSRWMSQYLLTHLDRENPIEVDWITGALLLIRKKTLDVIGPLDERYYLYSEDQDLCCRIWRNGWSVCYVPSGSAIHAHKREGIRKPWSAAARHQLVSAIKMLRKFNWRLSR